MTTRVAVVGNGSFGTALSKTIANNDHAVSMYVRDATVAKHMRTTGRNPKYLSDYQLPNSIDYTDNLITCVTGAEIVVLALPSYASIAHIDTLADTIENGQILVSTVKGVVDTPEFLITNSIANALTQHQKSSELAVLSGPNLAKEIIAQQYTGTVVAANTTSAITSVQHVLQNDWFSVHTSDDIVGVELGGALKNIYAIAAGMVDALGMGDNCKSLLLANGMFEIVKFAELFGANIHTLCGVSGVGDLITTCISPLSRNYRFGTHIVNGKSVAEAQQLLGGVAEGLTTLQLVHNKSHTMAISLPIVNALYNILYNSTKPSDFVSSWLHDQVFLHT